jgi:hypothetical protein
MNDETIISDINTNLNEHPSDNVIQAPNPVSTTNEVPKNNTAKDDISNVKIRTILKQRFKKWRPGLRKAIPFILVGIICFAAGIGADRVLIHNRYAKGIVTRPGVYQSIPKDKFNYKQFNNRNNTLPNRGNKSN